MREGLVYFGATDFSNIYGDALNKYRPEWYEPGLVGANWKEVDQKGYDERRFDAEDSAYFKVPDKLPKIVERYIREHKGLYGF